MIQRIQAEERMNKDDTFRQIIDIVSSTPCKWWLDAGTCLAVVRKGDFIAETDDVDIGLQITHTDPVPYFKEKFNDAGFTLSKVRSYRGLIMTVGFTGPEKVDLFFYHPKDGYLWHAIHGWRDRNRTEKMFKPEKFPEDLFMTLKDVQFKGRTVHLPNPPESYLLHRYGRDWRPPNPQYEFWRDSKAIDLEFA